MRGALTSLESRQKTVTHAFPVDYLPVGGNVYVARIGMEKRIRLRAVKGAEANSEILFRLRDLSNVDNTTRHRRVHIVHIAKPS